MSNIIKVITTFLIAIFKDLFIRFKMYVMSEELKKQDTITKEKVNEATKLADDFLADYATYLEQKRNELRPITEPVRLDGKSTEGSDKRTDETN